MKYISAMIICLVLCVTARAAESIEELREQARALDDMLSSGTGDHDANQEKMLALLQRMEVESRQMLQEDPQQAKRKGINETPCIITLGE